MLYGHQKTTDLTCRHHFYFYQLAYAKTTLTGSKYCHMDILQRGDQSLTVDQMT